MHVVLITDSGGARGAEVTLRGLLLRSRPDRVSVIDAGLTAEQGERLRAVSPRVGLIPLSGEARAWLDRFSLHGRDHVSAAAYAKLLLHRLLPDADTVLYLDTDVLVLQDPRPLVEQGLGSSMVGAVANLSQAEAGRARLELNDTYFNSGVMVCGLRRWREERIEERFASWYLEYHARMLFNDQEILNGVFDGRVLWLDKKWNVSHWEVLRYHNQVGLAPAEWGILHFNGKTKPWHSAYEKDIVVDREAFACIQPLLRAALATPPISPPLSTPMAGAPARAELLEPARRPESPRAGARRRIALTVSCDPLRFNLLRPFVDHYRRYGVEDFYINLHFDVSYAEDAQQGYLAAANAILDPLGLRIHSTYGGMFSAAGVRAHHDGVIGATQSAEKWVVAADLDEFHEFPDALPALTAFMDRHGLDHVQGRFVDRLARDGFPAMKPNDSIWKQFPLGSDMTRAVLDGCIDKIMLARGHVPLLPGHHYVKPGFAGRPLQGIHAVHHFKWDASVVERLQRRLQEDWKAACFWWVQSDRAIEWVKGRQAGAFPGLRLFDFEDDRRDDDGGPHSANILYRMASSREGRAQPAISE